MWEERAGWVCVVSRYPFGERRWARRVCVVVPARPRAGQGLRGWLAWRVWCQSAQVTGLVRLLPPT